jgi:glycosyltransferase involved in cell wall biosynthesis
MDNLAEKGISLVIPVYNEENNIRKAVQDGRLMLPQLAKDYEIIIVESGSTDKTGEVTDRLASEDKVIRVIHQGAKLGLGSALKAGFSAARYESIFYIDGDNPFRMSDFVRGFPLLQEADIVCGNRTNRQDTFIRAVYSKVFNLLMRIMFGVKVRDTQIGFKLLRKSIFERVKLTTDSMFIDAELLIKAQKAGYRITELGVEYLGKPSGKSSVTFREVAKIGVDLFKYRFGGLK